MGILNRIRKSGKPYVAPDAEPLSVTGRGHVDGFLNLEELNTDLQGRQGLEIYDRMFRTDGDVRQVVNMLSNPIIAGTWEVEPAGGALATDEDVQDAAFVRWALFENMSPNLRGHLMEVLPVLFRSGFTPFEKVWEVTEYEGQMVTVPRSLQLRLPRTIYRWKQDRWGFLEAVEQYLPVPRAQVVAGPNVTLPGNPALDGPSADTNARDDSAISDPTITTDTRAADYRQTVWLPTSNLLYYRVGAEGDNWEGVSLLRPAYKHWLFKDAIERMDAIAQEKEALGTPVCYPPLGATTEQLDAMEVILNNLRTNGQGYVIMPGPKATGTQSGPGFGQGWLLEYLSPGHNGTGRDPQPSLRYHTDKIAAAFIAEFIRIGHSLTGGNRSVAETQMDPFLVGVEAISGLIEDIINTQLVAPLMAYNRPKAKAPPRVRMSLIDATTLSQLADFILKLVQVGALIPDQTLEDFLRARADLPAADPDAVSDRGDLDDSLRREIIMGKNGNSADAPGTNGPAGSTTGGSAGGSKKPDNASKAGQGGAGAQPASKPTSAHDALTRKAVSQATLSTADPTDPSADAPPYMPGSERVRWRPQAFYEMGSDLDGIEDHFDSAPQRMTDHAGATLCTLAREMADGYPKRTTEHPKLKAQIQHVLDDAYGFGRQTVSREIEAHSGSTGYQLAAPSGAERARVGQRAHHAHGEVIDAMHHAISHANLSAYRKADAQSAAERAGMAALRHAARTHTVHAFSQGRDDVLLDAQSNMAGVQWGVRYTAILDSNTCDPCRAADDGVLRALDDPVRLSRKPPNSECDSTHSAKGNQCRCFEIPEPMPQGS